MKWCLSLLLLNGVLNLHEMTVSTSIKYYSSLTLANDGFINDSVFVGSKSAICKFLLLYKHFSYYILIAAEKPHMDRFAWRGCGAWQFIMSPKGPLRYIWRGRGIYLPLNSR